MEPFINLSTLYDAERHTAHRNIGHALYQNEQYQKFNYKFNTSAELNFQIPVAHLAPTPSPPIAHSTSQSAQLELSFQPPQCFFTPTTMPLDLSKMPSSVEQTPPQTPLHLNTSISQGSTSDTDPWKAPVMVKNAERLESTTPKELDEEAKNENAVENVPNTVTHYYHVTKFRQIVHDEEQLLEDFIESNIDGIPNSAMNGENKKRRIVSDVTQMDATESILKYFKQRKENNSRSKQSRDKQKLCITKDCLAVLFLRERIEEYERRIKELARVILDSKENNYQIIA